MCGRFTLTLDPAQLREAFPGLFVPADIKPRYNIAPSQPVAVIPNTGESKLDFFTWGLIPSWAKDSSIGNHLINARAETLAEKPAFRSSFKRRRCLILSDGFFEWKLDASGKNKTPHYIHMKSGNPFAFASGIYDTILISVLHHHRNTNERYSQLQSYACYFIPVLTGMAEVEEQNQKIALVLYPSSATYPVARSSAPRIFLE
jgi:putative SOS response-associated peptidase YedK